MFAALGSMLNSHKSGLLHLYGQFNSQKGRTKNPDGIGLHHSLDGVTNPEYKLLHFIQRTNFFGKGEKALAFNQDRCFHLAFCLQLILFHCFSIHILRDCLSRTTQTKLFSILFST
jgi:hypothetical protein